MCIVGKGKSPTEMNVVVYGGYGVVGRHIIKALPNDCHVFIIDEYGDVDNEDDRFRGMSINDIRQLFFTKNNIPNVIIDVTENATMSSYDDSSNIYNNVANCARLMDLCRMQCNSNRNQVTLFVGTWSSPFDISSSVFAYASHLRKELPAYFNHVNAVITTLAIPRIINGEYAPSAFGAIIPRILDCFDGKQQTKPIIFHESELQVEENVIWAPAEKVGNFLSYTIRKRIRGTLNINGHKCNSFKIIGMLIELLDIDCIEIQTIKSGRILVERRYGDGKEKDEHLKEWIRTAIDEFRNNNTETKPD